MRLRLLISLSLALLLAGWAARARTAEDFFNRGAQSYITNNIPQALGTVEQGLKQYPDNVKLKKLYALLKQQRKQQSQQQKQSQKNQQKQSQHQKSQNNPKQQKQQQPNQRKHQQSENQSERQKPKKKRPPAPSSAQAKKKPQPERGKAAAAKQMSPQEAKRLLDAQKGDEQFLHMRPQGKPRHAPTEDW